MTVPNDMSSLDIRLGDFGEARRVTERRFEQVQGYGYRAPEVILEAGWDSKVDIWNLACVVRIPSSPNTTILISRLPGLGNFRTSPFVRRPY